MLGQHNDEVPGKILGMKPAENEELKREKLIH